MILFLNPIAAFREFIAPYDLHERHVKFVFTPPQKIHFVHEGRLQAAPGDFVHVQVRSVEVEQQLVGLRHPLVANSEGNAAARSVPVDPEVTEEGLVLMLRRIARSIFAASTPISTSPSLTTLRVR